MAHPKSWNKYEVALLVEVYVKVTQEKYDLETELVRLSDLLRRMAVQNGDTIDDVYRNLNGMHWQYGYVRLAFENPQIAYETKRV